MILRIRFSRGRPVSKKPRNERRFAAGLAGFLQPAAALATAVGLWALAAEQNWTGHFAISSGVFSHWQVWLGVAAVLELCAQLLNRYARRGETAAS
ncbi:MAG TPA: hypothetical protein VMB03_11490 [Bryobacteraceae bacterium]|nr:hypothetical protein [Bryobacteraceae bacterium]